MTDELDRITPGCRVSLHYSLTLEDGTEIVSTFDEDPLDFALGDGTMAETLEQMLIGLARNTESHLLISGDEAFGANNSEKIQHMQKSAFPADMELEVGQVIAFTTPAGDEVPGQILEIAGEQIVMDFNHPLSGHMIDFRVRVLRIGQPSGSTASNSNKP
jgi:FKBP-type peptidyl-prolyl cis-trans isomerase SlpA